MTELKDMPEKIIIFTDKSGSMNLHRSFGNEREIEYTRSDLAERDGLEQLLERIPEGDGFMLVFYPATKTIKQEHFHFEIIRAGKDAKDRIVSDVGPTPTAAITAALRKIEG